MSDAKRRSRDVPPHVHHIEENPYDEPYEAVLVRSPDNIVVNLGDCTQAMTNDRYRAAVHRVLPMTQRRRFSIPYFANPTRDAVVAPLPELVEAGPRYRPFPWREFMAARAYDNFTDLGTDDTQVTDYRIPTA